jgi:hypothetical protein
MSPIEIDERADAVGADADRSGRRANKKGSLSISMLQYLELLDGTRREIREDKYGSIPKHLAPILARIGLDNHGWYDLVKRFGKVFKLKSRGAVARWRVARSIGRSSSFWA